jgi:eukaryotic-like serine/threonine-protein kinase
MSGGIRRSLVGLFKVASLVVALVTVALLAALITMHFAIHGAEVQIPALKGMTISDARSQTAGLGLNLDVDNRYYSSDVAAGHILTQSPAPGAVVRREWHVRVSESLGPQKVDVPEAVGLDERLAALKLRRVGLAVGVTAQLPYAAAPEGAVLAEDPAAHAQGIEGPNVSLLVAAPADQVPDGYVMPDLTGQPIVSAQAALARVGLNAEPPEYVDAHVPPVGQGADPLQLPQVPGSILAQQPPAGFRVDHDTVIHLTVAR